LKKSNFILIILLLLVNNCAILPISFPGPISYINYTITTYDVRQILEDEQTLGDKALSVVTKRKCKTMNLINNKKICKQIPPQK